MPISRKIITAATIQKTRDNTPAILPSFYVCPYADPNPGQPNDYSLTYFPDPSVACDINLAFITPNENKSTGQFGNTTSDTYLCHLRDRISIQEFITHMRSYSRKIFVSYIDSPNIHWDEINIENFVRNTEGEITPDGTIFTNDLIATYQPIGRMWDAETPAGLAMAETMKACFLRGIQRDPDNYVFIYTTYGDRDIDQQILPMLIDPTKNAVDKALYDLGFRQISDFITLRGSLSFLETMSYGDNASSRFIEADNYAIKYLAKGDASKLDEMRKFISIGVAPELTSTTDALAIAAACNPNQPTGYGRFMVWAANCPEGLSLFQAMYEARLQPLKTITATDDTLPKENHLIASLLSGNKQRFFATPIPASIEANPTIQTATSSWCHALTLGLLN